MLSKLKKLLVVVILLLVSGSIARAELTTRLRNGHIEIGNNGIYFLCNDALRLVDQQWRTVSSPTKTKAKHLDEAQNGVRVHIWSYNKVNLKRAVIQKSTNEIIIKYEYSAVPGLNAKEFYLTLDFPARNATELHKLFKGKKKLKLSVPIDFELLTGKVTISPSGTSHWIMEDRTNDKWPHYRLKFWKKYVPATGTQAQLELKIKYIPEVNSVFSPVVLGKSAQRPFKDTNQRNGWTGQGPGNDLSCLPSGLLVAFGVPFKISGNAAILKSTNLPNMPIRTGIINVNKQLCKRLYVLHTAAWSSPGGKVATYRLSYADGSSKEIPVIYSKHIIDWWMAKPPSEARLAWSGNNQSGMVGISMMKIENPSPDKKLVGIELISENKQSSPILIAATVLKKDGLSPAVIALLDSLFVRKQKFLNVSKWYKCPIPWKGPIKSGSALDFSFLNHKPAGKYGFLKRHGNEFVFSDKPTSKVRFWGTNVAIHGCFPEKQLASGIARCFAAQGVNLVRFHLTAKRLELLFDKYGKMNLPMLDKLEYFVAELKKNGIYIYMGLNDGLFFDAILGKKWVWPQPPKFASVFDPELEKALKIFATKFFTHVNPYTGKSIVDDPAVAMFQIINEMTMHKPDPLNTLSKRYRKPLTALWNKWLKANHRKARKLPLHFNSDPESREFAIYLQTEHYKRMTALLHSIGVKVPVCGSSKHYGVGDMLAAENAGLDFLSSHSYYDNPRGNILSKKVQASFWNRPPLSLNVWSQAGMMTNLCSNALKGYPLALGEWNYCYPNPGRNEGIPLLSAYASYQDADALVFYCAAGTGRRGKWTPMIKNPKIIVHTQQTDPATWGMSQVGAAIFRRGDVEPARRTLNIVLPKSFVSENINVMDRIPFLPALGRISLDFSKTPNWLGQLAESKLSEKELYIRVLKKLKDNQSNLKRIVSDTGQIRRYSQPNILLVDTPCSQIVSGQLDKIKQINDSPKDIKVKSSMRQGSVCVISIDGRPINQSSRMLVNAIANAANKTIKCNPSAGLITDFGNAPVVAQPFKAQVRVKNSTRDLKVFALNTLTGNRKKEIKTTRKGDYFSFNISPKDKTIYYEIVADK